jgi:hypothetical protein
MRSALYNKRIIVNATMQKGIDQQNIDPLYEVRPVQRYDRPIDTLDFHMRSRLHRTPRIDLPPPLNFQGRKSFRAPPPEARSYVPGGISGVYQYDGPVLQAFGVTPQYKIGY